MKKHIVTSVLYTVITAVLLGIVYPLVVTGLAHVMFPQQANGSLIERERGGGGIAADRAGVRWAGLFLVAALGGRVGNGYDATNSGGSNYAPTNAALATRVAGTVRR